MDWKKALDPALDPEDLPDEIVVPLRSVIEHAGGEYREIKVREPTFGQLEEMAGKSAIGRVAIATAVPEGVLKKLGSRDANKITAVLARFL